MASTFTLVEAIVATTAFMFIFAIFRRLARAPQPPAFLKSNIVAFGSAMLVTLAAVGTLAFEAFSMMPFIHSVVWSGLVAIACHIAIWAIVRSIIPLSAETLAKEAA